MSKKDHNRARRPMGKFRRVEIDRPDVNTIERLKRRAFEQGLDFEGAIAPRLFNHPGELFVNDRYDVIRERIGPMFHLSIKPHALSENRSWTEYQQIKSELVGPSNEGVELYPAEHRLVDIADQYHLWVVADPTFEFPFGFADGRVIDDT